MGASLNGTPQEGAARKSGPTFPGEPQQSLFTPAPPTWTAFVRWVTRAYVKQIAARVYPDSDGDQASDNMYRILEGRHKEEIAAARKSIEEATRAVTLAAEQLRRVEGRR